MNKKYKKKAKKLTVADLKGVKGGLFLKKWFGRTVETVDDPIYFPMGGGGTHSTKCGITTAPDGTKATSSK